MDHRKDGIPLQFSTCDFFSDPISAALRDNLDAPLEITRRHVASIYENDLAHQFSERVRFDSDWINADSRPLRKYERLSTEFEGRFTDAPHVVSGPSGNRCAQQGSEKQEKREPIYNYLGFRRLRDTPLLTQIGVFSVLGGVAYGAIGVAVYLITGREMRRRGFAGARIGRLFFSAWIVGIAWTYAIWLLR